ncbi:MAG: hypothetical protein EAZ99_16805 [Alphaproteobacteria bacterium]|nr:CorA family divalent cation transporter [Alphaproteobacteria bacterium]TAD87643.1 MAG: hypothetical protein EAZ99_16805 [Alphaproteobacteria bacterium]
MIRRLVVLADGLRDDPAAAIADCVWIDLDRPLAVELAEVEATLDLRLPPPDRGPRVETSDQFYRRGRAIYLHFGLLASLGGPVPTTVPLLLVVTPHCLVTVRWADTPAIPDPFASMLAHAAGDTRQPTRDTLLADLLETLIERFSAQLGTAELDLEAIAARLFDEEARPASRKLFDRARAFRTLLRKIGRRDHTVARMRIHLVGLGRGVAYLLAQPEAQVALECRHTLTVLAADIRDLTELSLGISQQTAFLQDAALGQINIDQNVVMKLFTIVSVLFLPPTLIGTIYGMNFEAMPELATSFGYPLTLVAMILSAAAPLWWFRRRGWF